nr:uncharacterized protein LOC107453658 isoform X2 [Parasteatoda tepidariorum]
MYRRHLRMVQDLESNNEPKSEFIHRVSTSIPVVYLAWNIAAETYNSVKLSNNILKVSLNTTEKVANFITRPVFNRFQKQLKSADVIACWSFQTLQEFVPYIIYQQQRIYKQTKDLYEDTVESGLRKYDIIKKLLHESSEKLAEFRASPYGEVCELALDFTLEAGEMYVDYYLPPLGDERPEKLFGDRGKEPVWKRTELLKNRMKERLYKHSLLKMQMMRLKIKSFIVQVYHTNLYGYIVNVSSSLPGAIVTTISKTFLNFQDVVNFLAVLLKLN